MIWRLTYCNKKGVEARVDIIKGDRTSVEIVKGSANPFTRSYKLDKNDKSGHIMTSSADIEFFETETFNIDDLKTSNETELKVEYFEANVLTWSGFILPDFFSIGIGSPNIVRMTASDRLSALKGVTLSDLPIRVSLRDLIELSLEQTGLSLAMVTQVQINQGSTNILDSEILSQRLTDTRGRSISCYDILMSIMVGTNSTIRQREGQWVVYNKLEHELRTPTVFFDKVEKGAIRTIQPVASSVGVYNEFGGGRIYPDNYDFSNFGLIPEFNFPDWTKVGEFNVSRGTKEIIGYSVDGQMQFGANTVDNYFFNSNVFNTSNYLQMDSVPIPYTSGQIEVSLDLNATAQTVSQFQTNVTAVKIAMGAVKDGSPTLWLNNNGIFAENNVVVHDLNFERGSVLEAQTKAFNLKGIINNPEGYSIIMRIYGSRYEGEDNRRQTAVHFAKIEFKSTQDAPKGNLYKTTQGSNFTKIHDIETTIFGDFIRNGLNGYFYEYPFDDTSNLYLPNGELSSPEWITPFDTTERPLLHHISRQKSRLFSVAHDILRANINVESFDPLAVFQDCKGGKYVVVSASFDFLRSEVDVELEQIAYDNTILKRDFIYSYFGEGESNIKSIGGIAGGGGGTGGGGMTSEQLEMLTNLASWWKLDEENDAIYSEKSVYSLKGVSALGLGSEGGSGGGADMLDSWANYTEAKADYYVPASLLVPFRDDTLSRLTSLEGIEIGGRNLIREVDIMSLGLNASKGTDDFGQYIRFLTINPDSPRFTHVKYEDNTQYTLSVEASVETGSHLYWYFVYTDGSNSGMYSTILINSATPVIRRATSAINKTIDYIAYTWASAGYRRIYNIKLEKANKPSDWSPAPEDLVSDWSTTDATSLSFIKNKPTTLAGYGITDAVTLNTAQIITGPKTFTSNVGIGTTSPTEKLDVAGNIASTGGANGRYSVLSPSGVRSYGAASGWVQGHNFFMSDETSLGFSSGAYASNISTFNYFFYGGAYADPSVVILPNKNVGIGTTNPLYKLDVAGTGRFTSSLITPKVDFGNGFTIEPSGTELVFKYNGVIKQRMLSTGTILATGGITALST